MTKYEYMRELESLLLDISMVERQEALEFYENYFEDAGPDREQSIITELGSPAKVAATIKADYYNDNDVSSRGFFTERGYEDSSYKEPKYEIIDGTAVEKVLDEDKNNSFMVGKQNKHIEAYNPSQDAEKMYTKSQENTKSQTKTDSTNNSNNNYGSYGRGHSTDSRNSYDSGYGRNAESNSRNFTRGNSGSRIILIILLCIFILPIGLPIIISVFAVFVGLVVSMFALWISFTIVGVVLTFVGIGLTVLGLVKLAALPALGITYAGTGLILFGVGLLFTIATVGLSIKVIPGIFRGFIHLCRLPFKRRSVIA